MNPLDLLDKIPALKGRDTLKKTIAGAVALLVAIAVMLIGGGDEASDQDALDRVCRQGLATVAAAGDVDICTHGPDRRDAFISAGAAAEELREFKPVAAGKLCPGNGRRGARVHILTGPTDKLGIVYRTAGLMERFLDISSTTHTQDIKFLCPSDTKPAVTRVNVRWGSDNHFTTYVRALEAAGYSRSNRAYLYIGSIPGYSGCGHASIGVHREDGQYTERRQAGYALVKCRGTGVLSAHIALHELGHVIGVVVPEALHSSGEGAWHCFDERDLMCYDDGGPYFETGGTMKDLGRCPTVTKITIGPPPLIFDCHNDDYWDPSQKHSLPWNSSQSRFLTRPKAS